VVSSTQPTVSLVVPSYQKGPYLRAALDSLLAQTYPHVGILVQDSESTDETRTILDAYRSRLSHVAIEKDEGQSDALQRGYARARGEILGWLNADDLLMPNAIESVVAHFLTEPKADVVYGHCAFVDAEGAFVDYYHDIQPVTAERLGNLGTFIYQPSAFFRRSALERVGGLARDLHYTMDWDLWCRIARSGGELRMVDEVWAAARIYPDTKSASGGGERLREIYRTNCRYKTTWIPRAALGYLYGAKVRPYCEWLNRPMATVWRLWTGSSVSGAVVEGIRTGCRFAGSRARIRFPLYRCLRGLEVEVSGPLRSASLNGETGKVEGHDRARTVRWQWPSARSTQAVELVLEREEAGAVSRVTRLGLDLAPNQPLSD